jgi:hypothetical protein
VPLLKRLLWCDQVLDSGHQSDAREPRLARRFALPSSPIAAKGAFATRFRGAGRHPVRTVRSPDTLPARTMVKTTISRSGKNWFEISSI